MESKQQLTEEEMREYNGDVILNHFEGKEETLRERYPEYYKAIKRSEICLYILDKYHIFGGICGFLAFSGLVSFSVVLLVFVTVSAAIMCAGFDFRSKDSHFFESLRREEGLKFYDIASGELR